MVSGIPQVYPLSALEAVLDILSLVWLGASATPSGLRSSWRGGLKLGISVVNPEAALTSGQLPNEGVVLQRPPRFGGGVNEHFTDWDVP